ncbi:MAG: type II toxin-antitoxin system VapC family toxin [Bryobacteraceae bacterium]
MIVLDSSALIAILDQEDDAVNYAKAIAEADRPLISTATLVEAGIVMLNRHGPKGARKLNDLIQEAGCQVESVTAQHAQMALEAYSVYGKGQNNKAALNYGDCFSYALAKATGLPLLFKGDDFAETDIKPALSMN